MITFKGYKAFSFNRNRGIKYIDTRGKHRKLKGKDLKMNAPYILFRPLQIKLKTDQRAKQKRSFAARKKNTSRDVHQT